MQNVTLNLEQKLYVIAFDTGYSCFGFDNARDHTNQIAQRLGQPELAFAPAITKRSMATASTGRRFKRGPDRT